MYHVLSCVVLLDATLHAISTQRNLHRKPTPAKSTAKSSNKDRSLGRVPADMNRYVPVLAQSRRPTCATAAITISRSCLQNVWSPFPKPQSSIRTYPAKMSTKCSLSQQRGADQREEELSILYVCLNWEYSSHTGISLGKGYQSSVDSDLFNGFYLNFHSNPISAVSKAAPPVDLLHFPKVAPIVSHRFQCFVALHDRSWCLSRGMKFTEAPTLNLNIKQETMSHSFRG